MVVVVDVVESADYDDSGVDDVELIVVGGDGGSVDVDVGGVDGGGGGGGTDAAAPFDI